MQKGQPDDTNNSYQSLWQTMWLSAMIHDRVATRTGVPPPRVRHPTGVHTHNFIVTLCYYHHFYSTYCYPTRYGTDDTTQQPPPH